jgi:uncharacterized membrane protein YbaN (DUF454 family)
MNKKNVKNPILKGVLLGSGFLCVFLGLLGIPLPVLPTTPFLILAACCFSYSSEKFYNMIVENKHFGASVRNYLSGKGIPLKAKIAAISLLWISLGLSMWLINKFWLYVVLLVVGTLVTWFIIRKPTAESSKH